MFRMPSFYASFLPAGRGIIIILWCSPSHAHLYVVTESPGGRIGVTALERLTCSEWSPIPMCSGAWSSTLTNCFHSVKVLWFQDSLLRTLEMMMNCTTGSGIVASLFHTIGQCCIRATEGHWKVLPASWVPPLYSALSILVNLIFLLQ